MHCTNCGSKLVLRFCENEGLVPYCNSCGEFKYPPFDTAVGMIVTNREQDKILLAKYVDEENFLLLSGFVKKGESAEKTISREIKELTKLNYVKFKYLVSKYKNEENTLVLYFVVIIENGEPLPSQDEILELKWFNFDEAIENLAKEEEEKLALNNAINELKKNKL